MKKAEPTPEQLEWIGKRVVIKHSESVLVTWTVERPNLKTLDGVDLIRVLGQGRVIRESNVSVSVLEEVGSLEQQDYSTEDKD